MNVKENIQVMIEEAYCSYEISKLLKEKGFDDPCRSYFINNIDYIEYSYSIEELTDLNMGVWETLRPTHQMSMAWLREDKKILISIFCHIDKGYWFCIQHFIDSPYKFATSESIHRKEEILGKIQYYDTYEEAVEAALKYVLETLI